MVRYILQLQMPADPLNKLHGKVLELWYKMHLSFSYYEHPVFSAPECLSR